MRITTLRFFLSFLSFPSWSSSKITPCIARASSDDVPEVWLQYRPIAKIRRRATTTSQSIEEEEEVQISWTNSSTTISSLPDDVDYDDAPQSFSSNLIHTLNSTITVLAEIGGPFASLALILAVALADSIPCIPSQPVAILSGAVFGFWKGILPFEIGQTLAIILCMTVGRFVRTRKRNRDPSHYTQNDSKLSQILEELTVGLNSKNWGRVFCTIVIARQSPVLPFSLGNYFVGAATSAPLVPAVLGTVTGVLPGNVMLVGAGAGGVALIRSNGFVGTALEIAGVISTLFLFYACYRAVCKVLCNGDSSDMEAEENIPLLARPTSPQTLFSTNMQPDITDDVATSA